MISCPHDECAWRAIAPSRSAAETQYAEHVATEHTRTVDATVPEGKVQVKFEDDGEWMTVSVEDAHDLGDWSDE